MTFVRMMAAAAVGTTIAVGVLPASAEEVALQPHRAFYTVALAGARSDGDVVGASGGMEVTLGKSCDGWHISQRFLLDLEAAAGNVVRQDLTFAAWESKDSRHYRFTAREKFGEESTAYRGNADRQQKGVGKAVFSEPDDRSFPLPDSVLFPVSHTRAIIETARRGGRLVTVPVFDGAVGKGAQETVTFIGTPVDGSGVPGTRHGPLLNHRGWHVRTAYFDPDTTDSPAEFEVGMVQLENGVALDIRLDYTSFSLRLKLTRIEPLAEPDC